MLKCLGLISNKKLYVHVFYFVSMLIELSKSITVWSTYTTLPEKTATFSYNNVPVQIFVKR